MKTNLLLGSAAVLALVACSKTTPEADTTTTTSGKTDPTTVVQPVTPPTMNGTDDMAAPKTNSLNGNSFKDAGHIGSDTAGTTDHMNSGRTEDSVPTPAVTTTAATTPAATTTAATTTAKPRVAPAKPNDNNKVHGNGTTPGTTGDLNSGDGRK